MTITDKFRCSTAINPRPVTALAASLLMLFMGGAQAQNALVEVRQMTPEIALRAAQAALTTCRDQGYQVAVAVVDRHGLLQTFLRDRFAGSHTIEAARAKAWTAASFRLSTTALAEETAQGKPSSGIRGVAGVLALAGGLPIDAAGTHVGAIGVSGAPGGEADDACASAGIAAVSDDLAF